MAPKTKHSRKASAKITAKKPIPSLAKPIKADFSGLFKALGRAIVDVASVQWDKVAIDFLDASLALGLKTEPEELAFLLVHRSMARAAIDLIGESINLLPAENVPNEQLLERKFSAALENVTFTLDNSFFKSPDKFALIDPAAQLLTVWLRAQGLSQSAADAIARRLPAYFIYSLHFELGRNRKHYEPLLAALDTPVEKAASRQFAWERYATLLNRQTEESVFDEAISLRQLYIPLRAAYFEENKTACNEVIEGNIVQNSPNRKVVSLAEELESWLVRNKQDDAIRVISGGPGSGKSVFTKLFASNLAQKGSRVLLIPLHLIDPERDVADEIGRFAKQEGSLGHDPLDPDNPEPQLLLIFDGLDELAGQGKGGYNIAREFVQAVERLADRRNLKKVSLRIILSGRELVIQENESLFRKQGQILELLPYFVSESDRKSYSDPKRLLSHDYRQDWWKTYGLLSAQGYTGLPGELDTPELSEITQQPLLNYLVALTLARGKLRFSKDLNLNKVYADLVERVYERGYEKGRSHVTVRHMRFEDFRRVLEEIGLAAWHGDGRATTVVEIKQHCEASGVSKLLEAFQDGAEKGVTRLLAAFFFRRYGTRPSGDHTFVFTHKSFGEYLAARRIVLAIRHLVRDLRRRDEDPDEGCSERTALENWAAISGPSTLTPYLLTFIRREVAIESRDTILLWQISLTRLFNSMLRLGMPMERIAITTFRDSVRQSRNAEEALLVALNSCALHTKVISNIEHPTRIAFGTWLRRIQEQRTGGPSCSAFDCLSYLNLRECVLHIQDLYSVSMHDSDLRNAIMQYCCLALASLARCNFTGAHIVESNLDGANLTDANLSQCFLLGTRLSGANLKNANFSEAQLAGVQFTIKRDGLRHHRREANFEGASFDGAKLEGAIGLPSAVVGKIRPNDG